MLVPPLCWADANKASRNCPGLTPFCDRKSLTLDPELADWLESPKLAIFCIEKPPEPGPDPPD